MSLILVCDAPGCIKTVEAKLTESRRLVVPNPWWAIRSDDGVRAACCDAHLMGQTIRTHTGCTRFAEQQARIIEGATE
jgi:predicted hotdog family 3-hydroxylacyl-ACP dehydratase